MITLKNTPKLRSKIHELLSRRSKEMFVRLNDQIIWQRYLRYYGMVSTRTKKDHFNMQDQLSGLRLSLPVELVEKMLLLDSAPPVPAIETLKELVLRGTVEEYSFGKHKISIYETVTDELLLLFTHQNHFEDYQLTEKKIKTAKDRATVVLPLSSKVLKIEDNKAQIQYNRKPLGFAVDEITTIDLFYEFYIDERFCKI